jgi:hypothetical protein
MVERYVYDPLHHVGLPFKGITEVVRSDDCDRLAANREELIRIHDIEKRDLEVDIHKMLEYQRTLEARCIALVWSTPGETLVGEIRRKAERLCKIETEIYKFVMLLNEALWLLDDNGKSQDWQYRKERFRVNSAELIKVDANG